MRFSDQIFFSEHFPNVVNEELYEELVQPGEIKNYIWNSCYPTDFFPKIHLRADLTIMQLKKNAFRVQKNDIHFKCDWTCT